MKFKLDTAGYFYEPEDAARLETLGFRFAPDPDQFRGEGSVYKLATDVSIEISTLEELVEFTRRWDRVVFSEAEIKIYDDTLD